MKSILSILSLCITSVLFSQQWSGVTTSSGNIYRSGKVGIGTVTSPSSLLSVQSSSDLLFSLERTFSGQNNTLRINFTGNPVTGLGVAPGSTIFHSFNPLSTSDILFLNGSSSSSPRFIFTGTGKFGIGTTTPTATLQVNGNCLVGDGTTTPTATLQVNGNCLIGDPTTTMPIGYNLYVTNGILTEKVKIAVKNSSNWADYVFEPTYNLMSLKDLERFVAEKKHLPNIPSASEVYENGIEITEITNKLLEKIEELSLYIIEINNKVETLDKELNSLKTR